MNVTRAAAPHHPALAWEPDLLGAGYERLTLPLPDDDEGAVIATLIRALPPANAPAPSFAFLAIHGWNDMFYQWALADAVTAAGGAFYAIDLRKYGRSWDPQRQSYGYTDSMRVYFADIDAALAAMRTDLPARFGPGAAQLPTILYGHSTGGLTAALYAGSRRGKNLAGLVLNSPWLELQVGAAGSAVVVPVAELAARAAPKKPLPVHDPGFYGMVLDAWRPEGMTRVPGAPEDTTDPFWTTGWTPAWDMRPDPAPIRGGWLHAVIRAQRYVARNVRLRLPVLMLTAARSIVATAWSEELRGADTVLDVEQMWARAADIASDVHILKLDNAVHDVLLSRAPVREAGFAEIREFCQRQVRRARSR